ncbi:MAG: GlsB/YeaQ/YmgE family stress response membrane protein [Deltaproteobacteria bacterium]|nr:GlsB/YeaQ/YmgE family stress response membrane protein [Deltaproteobacteria bacterium]
MGILTWILIGLLVGVLAKWLMPGDDPGGLVVTILLGIAGALVGGWIARLIGLGTFTGFGIGSLVIAVLGAMLLLFVHRKLRAR